MLELMGWLKPQLLLTILGAPMKAIRHGITKLREGSGGGSTWVELEKPEYDQYMTTVKAAFRSSAKVAAPLANKQVLFI